MFQTINFHPLQELPSNELDALQGYVQDGLTTIIKELLVRSVYYKGLTVTKTGPTELSISLGRYYRNGIAYSTASAQTINLTSYLPAGSNKKVVAIVASGQEIETDSAPRQFVTDVDTGATRTRTVSTRTSRRVLVAVVEGNDSLNPLPPTVGVEYAVLALVTLSSTGIVGEPDRVTDHLAPNLEDAITELALINGRLARAFSMIETMRNDIAGLAKQLKAKADQKDLLAAIARIADVERDVRRLDVAMRDVREAASVPDTESFFGSDLFDIDDESDKAHGSYSALVEDGILQLPKPTVTSAQIALLNPLDPKVKVSGENLVLPDYTEETRITVAVKEQAVAVATYPVVSHTIVRKYPGWLFKWFKTKWGGLVEKTMVHTAGHVELIDPATGTVVTINLYKYKWEKRGDFGPGLWLFIEDYQPYWLEKTTSTTVTGSTVAQTFQNSQAGWLTSVGLYFKTVAASGNVRVTILECLEDGTPNPSSSLGSVVVEQANLAIGWVNFPLDPVHLSRGERYAIMVKTSGAHELWGSNTNDLVNGTLFYSLDGDYWDGALNRDLSFKANFAKFKTTRVEVNLVSASRSGGMSEIDFTLTGVYPASVNFDIQAQIAGVWRNIDNNNLSLFAAEPSLVPLRAVWTNTQHDAVGFVLGASRLLVSKPDNTGIHISTARTLPAGEETKRIVVILKLGKNYSAGHHTLAVKLLYGASYASTKTATSTRITSTPAGANLEAVFDFVTAIDAYKIRTEFATDSAAYPISISGRYDNAESGAA